MSDVNTVRATPREPELLGQTVVVIGGSAGIGLETARRARAEGADVVLTGRDPNRLQDAASELDPVSISAFDANDPALLERFFRELPTPIDHVMVTAGRPHYGRIVDTDGAGLVIHSVYNGYWFWGRPSIAELWRDLRAATSEIRPDWDLSKAGLRESWDAGDWSLFHGWDRRARPQPDGASS